MKNCAFYECVFQNIKLTNVSEPDYNEFFSRSYIQNEGNKFISKD